MFQSSKRPANAGLLLTRGGVNYPPPLFPLKLGDYLALVEWTGQQVRPDKRGAIPKNAPSVLQRFESNPDRWAVRVKAIGSGYWQIVGDAKDLTEWAARLHQRWVKGIGLASMLTKAG